MKPPATRKTGNKFFGRQIGREVFFLFFLSTLLPMSILAYFTYSHFMGQRYRQAYEHISHDTRLTGMAVIKRLAFLETDIKTTFGEIESDFSPSLDLINHRFNTLLTERFIGLAVVKSRDEIIDSFGNVKIIPNLNQKQAQQIDLDLYHRFIDEKVYLRNSV